MFYVRINKVTTGGIEYDNVEILMDSSTGVKAKRRVKTLHKK